MTAPAPRAHGAGWDVAMLGVVAACASALAGAACLQVRVAPLAPATVVVGVAQPRMGAGDGTATRVASLLARAGLLRLEPDGRTDPALAERYSISSDALEWTLVLRSGITFHDGSPITASDVAAQLREAGAAGPAGTAPGLRDIDHVEAPDGNTVRIFLRAPSALLGEALVADLAGGPAGDAGAGPFVRAEDAASADGTVTLRAFENYYRGPSSISRVLIRPYATARTAWAAMMRGDIDFLYEVEPEAITFVESASDVDVRPFLRPFVHLVGFNTRRGLLARADVRRALSLAIDRRGLVARALGGRGRAAHDPLWPQHWAVGPDAEREWFSPARAVALLEAAGLPVRPASADGRIPPARFSFTCIVPEGVPLFERLGLAVQWDLGQVGVHMVLQAVPLSEFQRRLPSGDFDAYLVDLNAHGLSLTYLMWHSQANQPFIGTGYGGVDDLLDRVRRARSDDDVRDAVRDLRQRFQDDAPALFLCWREPARAVSRRFAVPDEPGRDVLFSLPRWHAAPR